jgi:hypothetical protein
MIVCVTLSILKQWQIFEQWQSTALLYPESGHPSHERVNTCLYLTSPTQVQGRRNEMHGNCNIEPPSHCHIGDRAISCPMIASLRTFNPR